MSSIFILNMIWSYFTLWGPISNNQILMSLFNNLDIKLGFSIRIIDGAVVAATPVGVSHTPINSSRFKSNWIKSGYTVEFLHLMGEQLTDGMKNQAANPEHMAAFATLHNAGDLLHLIPLNVDAAVNGKTTDFLLICSFQFMLTAEHGLVLKKHTPGTDSTSKMVGVWAPNPMATRSGTGLLTKSTLCGESPVESHFHIYQCPCLSLINFRGPQRTV